MKIPPSSDLLKSVQTPASGGSRPNGAASAAVPAAADRVTLSTPTGSNVSANAEAGFDRAKVEAIKAAIRDGTLSVDSGVVADRMLAQALALLSKGK
ncbi:MAG: flagellar biosynthesis anti-sigma factor FlgM [Burkholderiales bacterium]